MVVKGDFSVRIVEAVSKTKFQEHKAPHDHTKIYAEVEPDIEYYIEVEILNENPQNYFYFQVTVDDTELGHRTRVNCSRGKYFVGIWSQNEHTSSKRAFRFEKPTVNILPDGTTSYNPAGLFGKVEVQFFEAHFSGYKQKATKFHKEKQLMVAQAVDVAANSNQAKKVLRSGRGEHSESKAVSSSRSGRVSATYTKGSLVESITVNYCTALGLIKAGVLKKPDDPYAEHRMQYPWERPRDGPAPLDGLAPKRRKKEAVIENGKICLLYTSPSPRD